MLFLKRVIEEMPFPVQAIQTDRGREFFAYCFQEKLMEYGIKFRPIRPASPHLNGKVERSQRKFCPRIAAELMTPALRPWQEIIAQVSLFVRWSIFVFCRPPCADKLPHSPSEIWSYVAPIMSKIGCGVLLDLSQTLVLTQALEALRKKRIWPRVYAAFDRTLLPAGTSAFLSEAGTLAKLGDVTSAPGRTLRGCLLTMD